MTRTTREQNFFENPANYSLSFITRKNKAALLKGTLTLIWVDLLNMSVPLFVKLMIDRLSGNPLPHWLPKFVHSTSPMISIAILCGLYLVTVGAVAHGRYWWRVFLIWSTFKWFHEMRRSLFAHIKTLDREFFKNAKVGDLLSALTSDTESMRMTIALGSLMVLDATINFIIFPILLWQLSPPLTLLIVPPLLGFALGGTFLTRRLSPLYEKVQDLAGSLSGKAFELASGIRMLKAFRAENILHRDFCEESERFRSSSLEIARIQAVFVPGLEFVLGLAIVFALSLGGYFVIEGRLPLSNLVAFQIYLNQLEWPMMALGWFVQMFRQAKASETRVQRFAQTESKLVVIENAQILSHGDHLFEIENLSFQPANSKQKVFENLNLKLKSHQKWIGLTGSVGSGKTTLLELLSRQRDPQKGRIRFKGRDLKTFNPEEIREEIIYVPQESFLFSRSVRGNLNLGLKKPEPDEFLWQLLEDLSFSRSLLEERGGLSTTLGERGVHFSGGQKQRIALGRALSRKRSVYLFDDLFSHVDIETEQKLLKAVRKYISVDALVILVSQRLQTLKACDEILILKEGGLSFQGDFESAKRESSFFGNLLELQQMELEREKNEGPEKFEELVVEKEEQIL